MKVWPLQEAESHLSELLDRARAEGPQVILRHGREEGAVISIEELRDLRRLQRGTKLTVKDYLLMPKPMVEDDVLAPAAGPELVLRPTIVFE